MKKRESKATHLERVKAAPPVGGDGTEGNVRVLAVMTDDVLGADKRPRRCNAVSWHEFVDAPATHLLETDVVALLKLPPHAFAFAKQRDVVAQALRAAAARGATVVVFLPSRVVAGELRRTASRASAKELLGAVLGAKVEDADLHGVGTCCPGTKRNKDGSVASRWAGTCMHVGRPSAEGYGEPNEDRRRSSIVFDSANSLHVTFPLESPTRADPCRPCARWPETMDELRLLWEPFWHMGRGEVHVARLWRRTPQQAIDHARTVRRLRLPAAAQVQVRDHPTSIRANRTEPSGVAPGPHPHEATWISAREPADGQHVTSADSSPKLVLTFDEIAPEKGEGKRWTYLVRVAGGGEGKLWEDGWAILRRLYDAGDNGATLEDLKKALKGHCASADPEDPNTPRKALERLRDALVTSFGLPEMDRKRVVAYDGVEKRYYLRPSFWPASSQSGRTLRSAAGDDHVTQ